MKMINGDGHKVNSTSEDGILSVMDLLEPGGRKFVESGSAPAPEQEEEEEGADAAITPRDPESESRKPGHSSFFISLFFSSPTPKRNSLQAIREGKAEYR